MQPKLMVGSRGRSGDSGKQNLEGLHGMPVQAKLAIGQPDDKYEREADRVASQVVEQIDAQAKDQSVQGQTVQRKLEDKEEIQSNPELTAIKDREGLGEKLQRKLTIQGKDGSASGEASSELTSAINSARGGGQPLDAGLQQSMGRAMGADFSGVRVHTDARSDQLNKSLQAKAFTRGQDVFFRQGEYQPGTRGGKETIAHELTHVVQQSGTDVSRESQQHQQSSHSPNKETQQGGMGTRRFNSIGARATKRIEHGNENQSEGTRNKSNGGREKQREHRTQLVQRKKIVKHEDNSYTEYKEKEEYSWDVEILQTLEMTEEELLNVLEVLKHQNMELRKEIILEYKKNGEKEEIKENLGRLGLITEALHEANGPEEGATNSPEGASVVASQYEQETDPGKGTRSGAMAEENKKYQKPEFQIPEGWDEKTQEMLTYSYWKEDKDKRGWPELQMEEVKKYRKEYLEQSKSKGPEGKKKEKDEEPTEFKYFVGKYKQMLKELEALQEEKGTRLKLYRAVATKYAEEILTNFEKHGASVEASVKQERTIGEEVRFDKPREAKNAESMRLITDKLSHMGDYAQAYEHLGTGDKDAMLEFTLKPKVQYIMFHPEFMAIAKGGGEKTPLAKAVKEMDVGEVKLGSQNEGQKPGYIGVKPEQLGASPTGDTAQKKQPKQKGAKNKGKGAKESGTKGGGTYSLSFGENNSAILLFQLLVESVKIIHDQKKDEEKRREKASQTKA
ncbi:MAG: DUF4157 domain-containing protein [Hormoscilla sp. SP5CHS1]|nr:DUF4157 domain-containing protein [Hormoscilla sp. SP12CHS1]MBC6451849.1 DUF4157 domain-containing protein [Hormoscilla sp. SP5CHS1]